MIEININKIIKNYGFKNVLNNLNLEIKKNQIIGLIGENGCGKSTLLKLITKGEIPNEGTISIRKNATIGYLSQIPDEIDDKVINIFYSKFKDIYKIENNMNKLISNLDKIGRASCRERVCQYV